MTREANKMKRDGTSREAELERENRKLRRENDRLKNAIVQEKLASTTILNQHKASTFIQRERERYLALLLANSPSIILFLGTTGRIEFCTEYFVKKAGYKNAVDVLGQTYIEALSPFLDEATIKNLQEHNNDVIKTNAPFVFEITFHFDRDGAAENFAGQLVPMKDEKQHSNGVMLMFHDITDLKRSREEALAASKAKSSFLSNMSHEIRTPMNAIIGMTSIGKNEKDLKRKDYAFEKIENASTHLLGIINDILDISKIESGKMELFPVHFDFRQMLDIVTSVVALQIKNKRQNFSLEIDPRIPATLLGDDQRLAQVITNILSNAIKFTPESGCIMFHAELLNIDPETCVILMYVKDSGIGMSREEQDKLFNIFQQAEAGTTRKYGGSGLGLALSKRILELMDGEIWVESEKGQGSCFFFTASLDIPDPVEAAQIEADAKNGTGAILDSNAETEQDADFTGRIILLADDIEINLEIMAALLEPTNITIDTVRNGREAVDAFAANPQRYDLILMDVQMPEMDGLEATREIRALDVPQASTVPIVAMTANVFKEDIEKCIEAGMNDHLGKPIALEEVIARLSKYLKGSRQPNAEGSGTINLPEPSRNVSKETSPS